MKSKYYEWVGNELKNYRLLKRLTLKDVSERISVSPKQVQNYENGENKLTVPTLVKLCKIYGVDYSDFITRSIAYIDEMDD